VYTEKRKPVQRFVTGLLCIPGGALLSWLALSGIQLGDSIYRFPYFIILGGVLIIGEIVNAIGGVIALAHRFNTSPIPAQKTDPDLAYHPYIKEVKAHALAQYNYYFWYADVGTLPGGSRTEE
jgi:hypothetical protein